MCVCVVYVCFITDVVSVAVAAVVVVAPVLVPLIYTALKVEGKLCFREDDTNVQSIENEDHKSMTDRQTPKAANNSKFINNYKIVLVLVFVVVIAFMIHVPERVREGI